MVEEEEDAAIPECRGAERGEKGESVPEAELLLVGGDRRRRRRRREKEMARDFRERFTQANGRRRGLVVK